MTLAELQERVSAALGAAVPLVTEDEIKSVLIELLRLDIAGVATAAGIARLILVLSQEQCILRELLEREPNPPGGVP